MGGREEEDEKGEEEGGVWRACGDVEDDEDVDDVDDIDEDIILVTMKKPFSLGEKVES